MDENEPTLSRTSITINSNLSALRKSGSIRADNFSSQLDRLAQRYMFMIDHSLPGRMTPEDWSRVVLVVQEMTAEYAADVLSLPLRVKHINKQRHAVGDVSSLALRLEQMKPQELLAVVDLAERLIHAGRRTPDEVSSWLADNQIVTSRPIA